MASQTITVKPVEGRADTETFIRLPGQLAAGDPNWVEPLWFERRRFLTPKHNPFFQHAEVALWIARRDGRPVGRISAQIDRLAPDVEGLKPGFFGMLAAEDNRETVAALFAAAEAWLSERGAVVLRGPFDLSVNQTSGLLVEGFDLPPSLMMGHDQPWMAPAVEALGYAKAQDLVAYRMDCSNGLPDRMRKVSERASEGVEIRSLNMKRYDDEIRLVTGIFNDAWADNWGFIPLTEAEIDAMAAEMKPIIDPELVKIAEVHGEPAAFIVLLPNVNEAIADLGGRLLPFGWLKLLWRLKVTRLRTGRVPLMGTTRAQAATMLGKMLPLKLIYALQPRARQHHDLRELELSWLLEDNWSVRKVVENVGGKHVKTYRVYEKRLG
ncbi:MAG TPA: N-acetyltransferase [Thermohalobaculum sp.]|nr:N-acetyltransferase [Thermohalobaculum sp.]